MTFTKWDLQVLYRFWIYDYLNVLTLGKNVCLRCGHGLLCYTLSVWIVQYIPILPMCVCMCGMDRIISISTWELGFSGSWKPSHKKLGRNSNISTPQPSYLRFFWTGYEIIQNMITCGLIKWKFKFTEYYGKTVEHVNWSFVLLPYSTTYKQYTVYATTLLYHIVAYIHIRQTMPMQKYAYTVCFLPV